MKIRMAVLIWAMPLLVLGVVQGSAIAFTPPEHDRIPDLPPTPFLENEPCANQDSLGLHANIDAALTTYNIPGAAVVVSISKSFVESKRVVLVK